MKRATWVLLPQAIVKPGLHARSYCSGISKNCFYLDWSITMARRLNIFCVRQLMGFLVPEALFVSMGWGARRGGWGALGRKKKSTQLCWPITFLATTIHMYWRSRHAYRALSSQYVYICWLNWQILYQCQKSRSKYVPLLIVRRDNLSRHACLLSS